MFQTLHATSQDDLSLEFVAAIAGRECNIQDARGGGLCIVYICVDKCSVVIHGVL